MRVRVSAVALDQQASSSGVAWARLVRVGVGNRVRVWVWVGVGVRVRVRVRVRVIGL